MRQIVNDNLPCVWRMMDLALGLEGIDSLGTLTVLASDSVHTNHSKLLSLSMTWTILFHSSPHQRTERALRLVATGRRAYDYLEETRVSTADLRKLWDPRWERTVLDVALEPLDSVAMDFGFRDQATLRLILREK